MEPIVIPLMEEPLEKVATNASFSEVGEQAVGGGAQLPDGRVIPSDDRRLICLGMSSGIEEKKYPKNH